MSKDLLREICSFQWKFCVEVQKMSTILDILQLLVEIKMIPCMPELYTACIFFITIPVIVESCKQSFSKLKLIRTYL